MHVSACLMMTLRNENTDNGGNIPVEEQALQDTVKLSFHFRGVLSAFVTPPSRVQLRVLSDTSPWRQHSRLPRPDPLWGNLCRSHGSYIENIDEVHPEYEKHM